MHAYIQQVNTIRRQFCPDRQMSQVHLVYTALQESRRAGETRSTVTPLAARYSPATAAGGGGGGGGWLAPPLEATTPQPAGLSATLADPRAAT